MGWLCTLVVAVAIVALVGHLMWVLAATILRELFGNPSADERAPEARPFTRCPACQASADPRVDVCPFCGFQFDTPLARRLARVRAAEAEVRELEGAGDIDVGIAGTVVAQLERRARLLQGLPPDGATAVPEPDPSTLPKAHPVSALEQQQFSEPAAEPALSSPAEDVPPGREVLELPDPPSPLELEPAAPPTPRRGSVLAAFMEERNIFWGELVGGLLIVGCSIALVVTLWNRIETIPYFPFLLSAIVTIALYGAGHYTLHHWKLESTSRGLLAIALLLAPLNLLLLAEPISRAEVAAPLDTVFKLGAVVFLAWLVRGGGRDVLYARPNWRWALTLAMVGAPATALLPAGWFATAPHAPAWLALACFAGAAAMALRGTARHDEEPYRRQKSATILQFMGLAAFGLAAAWGLHLTRSPDAADRVSGLALPLALAAVPAMEAGFLVQRRVMGGALRATGTGVALAGFSLMATGLVMAWPHPLSVLLVSLAIGVFLTRIALRDAMPWAHAGAIPALALAVAVGYHGLAGHWTDSLSRTLGSAETALVLAALAIVLAAVAEVLARRGRRPHAVSYALGGAGVGLVGLFLAAVNGPEHPTLAAVGHGLCAIGLLAANTRWRLRVAAHGGLWLALIATLWALHAGYPGEFDRWGFAVAVESLAFAGLALLLRRPRAATAALLREAGRDMSIAAAVLAVLGLVFSASLGFNPASGWHAGTLFTLALTGLALARVIGAPLATYLGSVAAALGVIHLASFHVASDPAARSYLAGLLALATAMTGLAAFLRRRERVFANPLRRAAQVVTGLAAALLLVPPTSHALEWAGYAAWLALPWLAIALIWRERAAFSVFQVALSAAAVLVGVAWVDAREWRPATSSGFIAPAALHVYAVALALLGAGWVAARRGLRESAVLQSLWISRTWSAERVILSVLVIGHLLLLVAAIVPEVRAELAPAGRDPFRPEPMELAQAFGPGAWVVLGALAAVVAASWRCTGGERDTDPHLLGLVLLFLTIPVLWAGSHAPDVAAGTALRWGLGIAFVTGTAGLAARRPLRALLGRAGFPLHESSLARPVVLALLAVAAGVVVVIFAQVTELGLTGRRPSGPVAGSPFAAMGAVAANLVPLALVVLGLAGTAVRERSGGYAFAGGLVFTATLMAAYALGVVTGGGRLDGFRQVHVVLLAWGGLAAWSLAWLAAEKRVPGGVLLAVQSRLGLAGMALTAFLFALPILVRPAWGLSAAGGEFGRLGWIALALAAGAAVWRAVRSEPRVTIHSLALTATVAVVLAACAVQPWDSPGRWLSFHALGIAGAVTGVGLAIAARKRDELVGWLDGFAAVLALMALHGVNDPWRPWLPAGLAVVAAGLVGAGAVRSREQARVIVSGLLINLAAVLFWLASDGQTAPGLFLTVAAGLALAVGVWTAIALRLDERGWRDPLNLGRGLALVLLAFGLAPTLAGDRADSHWLTWGATIAVAASLGIALWDSGARIARGGLFAAGVAVVLLGVTATTTLPVWDVWQAPVALAAYVMLTTLLIARLVRTSDPVLRIPERGGTWGWFLIAAGVVAVVAIGLGLRIELTAAEWAARLAGPGAVALLLSSAFLLRDSLPRWRETLGIVQTCFLACLFVTLAWSIHDPANAHVWLHRNARAFVFLTIVGLPTLLVIPRVLGLLSPRRDIGVLAALAFIVLCINLVQQVPVYNRDTRRTPLEPFDVMGMLLGVVILIVLSIRFALRQDLDPLGMRDSRRTIYVYLAEVLLVFLFTHIRFHIPELFLPAAVRYWTFAVMGLAFVGIGLAELFERLRVNVLAVPLRRTGVLLPLIPLLAFWAKPPEFLTEFAAGRAPGLSPFLTYLEKLPQHFDDYAWLWFLAGGVYGLVALSKRSFGWALLAALATNAALWSLLTHHEVPFIVHPQAWVIPLALIVLVSEHVNRHRLREDVSNGMRYLGVAMIYVASAADMFIAGVGQSVWLPVVLAVLCVAGVLAGIMMRVRAFLFLGVGFLFLDIFSMIWHAAVNLEQTWVWYASGIVLGVAILALFAVFEKRKKREAEV